MAYVGSTAASSQANPPILLARGMGQITSTGGNLLYSTGATSQSTASAGFPALTGGIKDQLRASQRHAGLVACHQLVELVVGLIGQLPLLLRDVTALAVALRRDRHVLPQTHRHRPRNHRRDASGEQGSPVGIGGGHTQQQRFGALVRIDDGSAGRRGFVTDLLKELLASGSPPTSIYCCGPEPMMRAVAKIANESGVRCLLSLETPMACGIGACFSCVTKIAQDDGTWDYRRVCVEGPVFPADRVVFD